MITGGESVGCGENIKNWLFFRWVCTSNHWPKELRDTMDIFEAEGWEYVT